jgi:hypothetical protein
MSERKSRANNITSRVVAGALVVGLTVACEQLGEQEASHPVGSWGVVNCAENTEPVEKPVNYGQTNTFRHQGFTVVDESGAETSVEMRFYNSDKGPTSVRAITVAPNGEKTITRIDPRDEAHLAGPAQIEVIWDGNGGNASAVVISCIAAVAARPQGVPAPRQ